MGHVRVRPQLLQLMIVVPEAQNVQDRLVVARGAVPQALEQPQLRVGLPHVHHRRPAAAGRPGFPHARRLWLLEVPPLLVVVGRCIRGAEWIIVVVKSVGRVNHGAVPPMPTPAYLRRALGRPWHQERRPDDQRADVADAGPAHGQSSCLAWEITVLVAGT